MGVAFADAVADADADAAIDEKFPDTATYVSPAPTTIAQNETEAVWLEGAVQENLNDDNACLELCVIPPAQLDICRR